MTKAVILSGARTPVGVFMGGLAELTAPQLGSAAIKAALERSGVSPNEVSEVLMGCVLTGGMGQAPARQASLGAGIPNTVPCMTINKVCGSGMKTIMPFSSGWVSKVTSPRTGTKAGLQPSATQSRIAKMGRSMESFQKSSMSHDRI